MLSRALSLATVTLLIGCFAAIPVQAQNLEAGKSPSQIFAGTCNACHKSPRGLLKTVSAGSLPGFLRQHYTTSSEMAGVLSSFLVSNGAADTRYTGGQPKQGKDAKPDGIGGSDHIDRFGRRQRTPDAQQAARPDADGLSPQGRNAKRPADVARPAVDGQDPAQAGLESGPDGRKSAAKQKVGKKGRPGSEEPPKTDIAKPDVAEPDVAKKEPAKGEEAVPKTEEAAKEEGAKPDATSPSGEDKTEAAKLDVPKETGSSEPPPLRADPVPPVTPAPPASPAVSAEVSSTPPEPAAPPPSAPDEPPAVTAAVPPPIPVVPAGPPAPPISQ